MKVQLTIHSGHFADSIIYLDTNDASSINESDSSFLAIVNGHLQHISGEEFWNCRRFFCYEA